MESRTGQMRLKRSCCLLKKNCYARRTEICCGLPHGAHGQVNPSADWCHTNIKEDQGKITLFFFF